jgi:hypothetical protein
MGPILVLIRFLNKIKWDPASNLDFNVKVRFYFGFFYKKFQIKSIFGSKVSWIDSR